jgi:phosphoethanolamine N-methyltransferase
MYWYYYRKFCPAARASKAHSKLCQRVFGEDLCQEGQTDMAALEHMLALLGLTKGERVLDLGCGAGVIAEYISDKTGALVTGIDYAASAISEAVERTASK